MSLISGQFPLNIVDNFNNRPFQNLKIYATNSAKYPTNTQKFNIFYEKENVNTVVYEGSGNVNDLGNIALYGHLDWRDEIVIDVMNQSITYTRKCGVINSKELLSMYNNADLVCRLSPSADNSGNRLIIELRRGLKPGKAPINSNINVNLLTTLLKPRSTEYIESRSSNELYGGDYFGPIYNGVALAGSGVIVLKYEEIATMENILEVLQYLDNLPQFFIFYPLLDVYEETVNIFDSRLIELVNYKYPANISLYVQGKDYLVYEYPYGSVEYYFGMNNSNFEIILYRNNDEPIKVKKNLTLIKNIFGSLRDNTNILNPVIMIELDDLPNFNYVFLPIFNRYYYLTDITHIRNSIWEMSLSVDVLKSYEVQLYEQTAYIDRNEFEFDMSIIDDKLPIKDVPTVIDIFQNDMPEDSGSISYTSMEYGVSSNQYSGLRDIQTENDYDILIGVIGDNYSDDDEDGTIIGISNVNSIYRCRGYFNKLVKHIVDPSFFESVGSFFQSNSDYVRFIRVYPFNVNYFLNVDTTREMNIGKLPLEFDFNIEKISGDNTKLRLTFKGGHIKFDENTFTEEYVYEPITLKIPVSNTFLASSKFCSVECFLPYVGFVDLDADFVLNNPFYIVYDIDIATGEFIATITERASLGVLLSKNIKYVFNGKIGYELPLGASNANEIYKDMTTIGVGLALSSYSASSNAKFLASQTDDVAKQALIQNKLSQKLLSTTSTATVGAIASSTPRFSGGSLNLGSQNKYVGDTISFKIKYFEPIADESYNHMYGRPLCKSRRLGDMKGLTIISNIHLENMGDILLQELEEIEELLISGVIF